MKETTYESVVEKKKHELEINDQEKARISKQKREPHKKKMGPKKKKAAGMTFRKEFYFNEKRWTICGFLYCL